MDFSLIMDSAFHRPLIRAFHFVGLALGLGTATFLDLILLRFMVWGKITGSQAQAFHFGTKVVTAGLVILWITGLLFLLHYWIVEPQKLANPKIWAKLSIVGVLTVNAIYLHSVVLPMVTRQVSRTLFAGTTTSERICMVIGGATSATSWYVPVVLGVFPQLNFSVSAPKIWLVYCVILTAAITFGCLLLALVRHKLPDASSNPPRVVLPALPALGQ